MWRNFRSVRQLISGWPQCCNLTPKGAVAVAAAGSIVAGGTGAIGALYCKSGRAHIHTNCNTPLPPRPVHHVLRPDVDPRIDPSILIRFDPPEHLRTGAAIIILPGGNYENVCMTREGQQVAVWLAGLGITAFVLRYRCVSEGHYWPAQMEDFELAMRLIRTQATAWHVDRCRIGVIGFSAGGHLAGMAAVSKDAAVRPNAQILIYPTIDVTKPDWWYWKPEQGFAPPEDSPHLHVRSDNPPAFLAVSTEDDVCIAEENTFPYAAELQKAQVPVEHIVQPMGKHGHALRGGWTAKCEVWLASLGWTANQIVQE